MVIRPGHEHFAIGFQYRDKFKGGGGDHPCHPPPPPDPPLDKKKQQPKNRSRAPVVKLIYLPIELRASYTSCDPLYLRPTARRVGFPGLACLTYSKSRWRWIYTRYNNVINNSLIVLLWYSYAQSVQCRVYAVL